MVRRATQTDAPSAAAPPAPPPAPPLNARPPLGVPAPPHRIAAIEVTIPLKTFGGTQLGDGRAPESAATLPEPLLANGPAAAAVLAAGAGAAILGAVVTAEGISASLSKALIFVQPVGPLSGKTTVAVVGWLLAWAVLHWRLRDREVDFGWVTWATCVLAALGVLLTFPPAFDGVRDLLVGE